MSTIYDQNPVLQQPKSYLLTWPELPFSLRTKREQISTWLYCATFFKKQKKSREFCQTTQCVSLILVIV